MFENLTNSQIMNEISKTNYKIEDNVRELLQKNYTDELEQDTEKLINLKSDLKTELSLRNNTVTVIWENKEIPLIELINKKQGLVEKKELYIGLFASTTMQTNKDTVIKLSNNLSTVVEQITNINKLLSQINNLTGEELADGDKLLLQNADTARDKG